MAAHTNVCVIGLGSMGMGAARACLQAGLNTWGVDINPDNCRALLAAGAKGAGPSAVPFAAELDAVVLLVVNAAQVRGILFGESGLAAHLKPGTAVMVSSTIAAADAQAIAVALAEYQLLMLDAPVSGGAVKAAAGDMTIMASGSDAAFARLAPVLDAVVTVCDAAAAEACPVVFGDFVRTHWGQPDPAVADAAGRRAAFEQAHAIVGARIRALLAVPDATWDDPLALKAALDAIAALPDWGSVGR